MKKLGFIGIGKMGNALLQGALKKFDCSELAYFDPVQANEFSGVCRFESNFELVKNVKYVILAVKPQIYADVLSEISGALTSEHVVFSIAPGKTISYVKESSGNMARIVRFMPNTAAQIGLSMTGVSFNPKEFSVDELEMIDAVLSSIGEYEVVSEDLMNAVVCASGSSPAYIYEFIISLCKAVESYGLSHNTALNLICGTIIGAAKMVKATGLDPAVLKQNICSKGGTTLCALEKLDELGFSTSIKAASDACLKRSEELAN